LPPDADTALPVIAALAKSLNKPIETTRLRIKPLMSTDADAAFPLLQDERIYQWISMNKPQSVESLRADWKRNEARISPDGREAWLAWFVTSKTDDRPIGSLDVCVDHHRVATNVGYYFFADAWGQGYASEAVKALSDTLAAHRIHRQIATVTAGNAASVRVLEKAGFRFTRIIPDNDTLNGVLVDDGEYVRS
jgi:[ribosomal protein S5]-alanine N-acetyltransferase